MGLLALAWYAFHDATVAREQAEAALKEAAERSMQLTLERDGATAKSEELQDSVKRLTEEFRAIKGKAGAEAKGDIDRAQVTIARIEQTNTASALSPRVYIHIAQAQQRTAARELELGIESERLGNTSVIVPGIEQVKLQVSAAELRCFVAEDCKVWGDRLLKLVNSQLVSPKVKLNDFSGTYTNTGAIRGLHFELYFPPGEIVTRRGSALGPETGN